MKTEDLIEALVADLSPVRPARPNVLLILAAGGVAAVAVILLVGVRPGLGAALGGPAPWLKATYTMALAVSALWLATRLGSPGANTRLPLAYLVVLSSAALLIGAAALAMAPPAARLDELLGRTWASCGPNILAASLATAPLVFLAVRQLAPTRPAAMGGALSVAAGAIAATAYGVLYCAESSPAFVAAWYTLGIAAAGLAGCVAGRFTLRW